MTTRGVLIVCLVSTIVAAATCDRTSGMKGQTNAKLTFYGLAVDQDGKPLSGAKFRFRVEAYPRHWTYDTRGRDNDVSWIDATSGSQGRFEFVVRGCQLIRMKAECDGYRHFCDLDHETRPSNIGVSNFFYSLIEWSDPRYKAEPDHPAVFVFVRDGVHEVSALPCKGGYRAADGAGTRWALNNPGWPWEPSLKDVVYKRPETRPSR